MNASLSMGVVLFSCLQKWGTCSQNLGFLTGSVLKATIMALMALKVLLIQMCISC